MMRINFPVRWLSVLLPVLALACHENSPTGKANDPLTSSDSMSIFADSEAQRFKAAASTGKSVFLDTLWHEKKLTFAHILNSTQDTLEICLDGYPAVRKAISGSWLDADERNRILLADKNWKAVSLVFLDDSLCLFNLNTNGNGRAGAVLLVLNEKQHSFGLIETTEGNYRADLTGQVYFIVADTRKGLCYIHSSLGPDTAEVYGRDIFCFRATRTGFIQSGDQWRITMPAFDTLLYPYESSPVNYRKYFTKALSTHR